MVKLNNTLGRTSFSYSVSCNYDLMGLVALVAVLPAVVEVESVVAVAAADSRRGNSNLRNNKSLSTFVSQLN